jgi:hypothetical protein
VNADCSALTGIGNSGRSGQEKSGGEKLKNSSEKKIDLI